jgi:hypothetical protein
VTIAIVPPQGVPYNGSTLPRQALLPWQMPKEVAKAVPLSIFWATDGGPNLSVNVNLQSTQVVSISQIVALYVDNIRNQAAVHFYFPDTQFVLEIPPLSFGWYPVITTGIQFTVWAPGAVDQDQTIIQVLNYWVDPVAVSNFAFADTPAGQIIAGNAITVASQSLTFSQLLPAGTEGILTAFNIDIVDFNLVNATGPTGVGFSAAGISLVDAANAIIYWEAALFGNEYYAYKNLITMTGMNIEMVNGLFLRVNATNAFMTGLVFPNIYWRAPS